MLLSYRHTSWEKNPHKIINETTICPWNRKSKIHNYDNILDNTLIFPHMNIHKVSTSSHTATTCTLTQIYSMWDMNVINTLIYHMDIFSPPNNCFHSSAHKSCQCPYSIFLPQNQDGYNNHNTGANPGLTVRINGSSIFILIPLFMVYFQFVSYLHVFPNEESFFFLHMLAQWISMIKFDNNSWWENEAFYPHSAILRAARIFFFIVNVIHSQVKLSQIYLKKTFYQIQILDYLVTVLAIHCYSIAKNWCIQHR